MPTINVSVSSPWTADSDVTADSPNYTASGSYSPQFPNVPALPGVPPLARLGSPAAVAAGATAASENQALAAALGLPAGTVFGSNALYAGLGLKPLDPSYAILATPAAAVELNPGAAQAYSAAAARMGNQALLPVLTPDSFVEVDFSAASAIMTHPIEQGAFVAYNRIQNPISIRLLLACQGKKSSAGLTGSAATTAAAKARSTFLTTLNNLREGTQLVVIATPDATYQNMALQSYAYKKTADHGAVTIWADTQWTEARSTNVVLTAPATMQPQGARTTNLGALSPVTPTAKQQAVISNPPVVPVDLPQFSAAAIAGSITSMGNGGMPPSGDAF